ncbi:MAG TPA: ribonuclease HI family protein [Acidimicrobiia bacterium]|nr:ribonuclease HI family protein [Acidimicrobiia bacterium]
MPAAAPSLFDDLDQASRPAELVVYCDGGSRGNPGPSAIGALVLDPATDPPTVLHAISERIGTTTNNVAEYRALIAGLEAAAPHRARRIRVRADSKLVIEQVAGRWKVRHAHLRPLFDAVRALLAPYDEVDLAHVPRAANTEADALVNAALDGPADGDSSA